MRQELARGSRWLVLGLLWLVSAGCGDDGPSTTPTPATPNFAGTWVGSAQLQGCTGNQVACTSTAATATTSTEFVLTQTGTAVTGTWTLNNAEPRISVSGTVAADGSLNLTGRPPGFPVAVDSSRLTVAGTTMSGTLTYTFTFPDPALGSATPTVALQGVTRR
jgi:hypothetical protein